MHVHTQDLKTEPELLVEIIKLSSSIMAGQIGGDSNQNGEQTRGLRQIQQAAATAMDHVFQQNHTPVNGPFGAAAGWGARR